MRVLSILLFCTTLFGFNYDDLLLRAQATMYPKILLLDKTVQEKILDDTLTLTIVYSDTENKVATKFKKFVDEKYKNKIGKYNLVVKLKNIKHFNSQDVSTAYYLFDASVNGQKNVVEHAKKKERICFSYHYEDFKNDTLISLFLKEKTYIYINKSMISQYNIKFIPIFYNIVKIKE